VTDRESFVLNFLNRSRNVGDPQVELSEWDKKAEFWIRIQEISFKCRVIQLGLGRGEIVFFVTKRVWVSLSSFSEQGRVNQRELTLGTERVRSRELGGLVIVPQP